MKEQYVGYLLGNLTGAFILAFYTFVLMGLVLNLGIHYMQKKKGEAKKGNVFSFDPVFFIMDNATRVVTNLLSVFVLIRFYSEMGFSYELNMFVGVVVGFGLDKLIVLIRNKTKFNVFQTKPKGNG